MKLTIKISLVVLSLIISKSAFADLDVNLTLSIAGTVTGYVATIKDSLGTHTCKEIAKTKITKTKQDFACDANYQITAVKNVPFIGDDYYTFSVHEIGSNDVLASANVTIPGSSFVWPPSPKYHDWQN